ncbi:7966_t:CDS:2, partial [Gigaspora margarita]
QRKEKNKNELFIQEIEDLKTSTATTNPISSVDLCPGKYIIALEQLNLQTSKCLVIEDSHQGVERALDVELNVILVVNEKYKQDYSDLCENNK